MWHNKSMLQMLLIIFVSLGAAVPLGSDPGIFSGRVSRLSVPGKLMRLRVDFINSKYLRENDNVEFWNESYPQKRCSAVVKGKSPKYILFQVPEYDLCIKRMFLTTGSFLFLESEDLRNNIKLGEQLIDVLQKKRLALESRMRRFSRDIDNHQNRVDLISKRYQILMKKLEIEQQEELASLERDYSESLKSYQNSKSRLDDLMFKLKQYQIGDENLKEDRWSLDDKLYFKK